MQRLLAFVFALLLAATAVAQERPVRVQLDDGATVVGTVVSIDSESLRVRIGEEVRTIATSRIRSYKLGEPGEVLGEEPAPAPPPAPADVAPTPAPVPPEAAPPSAAPEEPAAAGAAGEPEPQAASPTPRATWNGPLQDPPDPEAQPPHDERHRSRLRARLDAIAAVHPWIVPTHPAQWLSMGLLLVILTSLAIHGSVRVAGAEGVAFGRSATVASWYLVVGAVQVAAMPCNDFTVVLMLLANPALALFWLTAMFGMSRPAAMVAFALQLGVGALAHGVLELVTAVLGSIGTPVS